MPAEGAAEPFAAALSQAEDMRPKTDDNNNTDRADFAAILTPKSREGVDERNVEEEEREEEKRMKGEGR